jgi:hypothetical protein
MALFLQLTSLLWAATILTAQGIRRSAGREGSIAGVLCALFILLIVSITAPPAGACVVALVLLAHLAVVAIVLIHDRQRDRDAESCLR